MRTYDYFLWIDFENRSDGSKCIHTLSMWKHAARLPSGKIVASYALANVVHTKETNTIISNSSKHIALMCSLYILTHLILTISLSDWYYYFPILQIS